MIVISPELDVSISVRRPRNWRTLEAAGWMFLRKATRWELGARERLAEATELMALDPNASMIDDPAWWNRYLGAYVVGKDVCEALRTAGEPQQSDGAPSQDQRGK